MDPRTVISIAFAWGPAIDLVIESLWTLRGSTHSGERLVLALVAVLARWAIARFAFRAATRQAAAAWLFGTTLVLGAALRLANLWPLIGTAGDTCPLHDLAPNVVLPPVLAALYAALLPQLLRRRVGEAPDLLRISAAAAFWVALGQAARLSPGYWDSADFHLAFLGLDWMSRFILGVVTPFCVATGAGLALASSEVRWTRLGSIWLPWLSLPPLLYLFVCCAALFSPADPFVVAVANTPNGTRLVLSEIETHPCDVLLSIRRPGEDWMQWPLVMHEPLWPGRIDVASRGTTATISAFDVPVAIVDWQSGTVTPIAPMTWHKTPRWRPVRDPLRWHSPGFAL
jgi:hypothetical protein